jgi:hypothetical protein
MTMDSHRLSPISRKTIHRIWAIPLIAVAVIATGCFGGMSLFKKVTPTDELKVAASRPAENSEISQRMEQWIRSILSDPADVRLLRGMKVSASLIVTSRDGMQVIGSPLMGHYRGTERVDPNDLVALVYGAYFFSNKKSPELAENTRIRPRLSKALRDEDHIRLNKLLDELTQSESGPPLEGKEFEEFQNKRYKINRWLESLQLYPAIKVGQKIWETAPYGRDIQLLGSDYQNSNSITSNALARLMLLVAEERLAFDADKGAMLKMMALERSRPGATTSNFISNSLPITIRMSGFVVDRDEQHHEVAIFDGPSGTRYVLVILTDRQEAAATFIQRFVSLLYADIESGALPKPTLRPTN